MKNFRTSEITKLEIGQLDCRSSYRLTNYQSKNPGGGVRGEIRELSRQSRSRLIYKARNTPGLLSMITFTYPHEDYAITACGGDFMRDGLTVKNHLRKLRQVLTYRGLYGFWFLEFQKRGAPHFHFCVSGRLEPSHLEKLRLTWYRMVGSSCPHHLARGCDYQVLRKVHAAGAYAAKYSAKDEQKTVPDRYKKVGRFWGMFGKIPNRVVEIEPRLGIQELYRMQRIARNYAKSQARANGYFIRRSPGRGRVGKTLPNSAPVLLAYLKRFYTIPESPSRIDLILRVKHTIAFESPLSEGIAGTCVPHVQL